MSFFRYPGGKRKIKHEIIDRLKKLFHGKCRFREPFFGGGSIGYDLALSGVADSLWINDKDPGLMCLWLSVLHFSEELIELIGRYKPSVEDFFLFRENLSVLREIPKTKEDILQAGFQKLVIHQISYSGLGMKSGGPLGGVNQESAYKIDCRWYPKFLVRKIQQHNHTLTSVRTTCTSEDFEVLLGGHGDVVYLDPPYYVKGNDLYQFGFSESDHLRLSESLRRCKHRWLLSYDDHPDIREMYEWASIDEVKITYSITQARRKSELVICQK
jgi:DNA adenine methylase